MCPVKASGAPPHSPGWTSLPDARSPRWLLPRGPRRAAANSVLLYQPVTARGLAVWTAARVLGQFGAFRLLPRGAGPDLEWSMLDGLIPPDSVLAVARGARHRSLVLVLNARGDCRAVAKLAFGADDRVALATEAEALLRLGPQLPPAIAAPRLLTNTPNVLLLEAIPWHVRLAPWQLPIEVAGAIGQFFRAGPDARSSRGLVHGDCAPWNLLRTDRGWVLVDWENAATDGLPFFDIFHYLVQSHALLGRPSHRALIAGLRGQGWSGAIIRAFAEAAALPPSSAPEFFTSYLQQSQERLVPGTRDYSRAMKARARLLAHVTR